MAKKITQIKGFDSITLEGALFAPDILEKSARGEASEQREADYLIPRGLKLSAEYGRAFQIAAAQWKNFAATRGRHDSDP
ncbi:MAG: hypothetical protein HQM10_16610 [Candidatus Riflebacteria bacterium]|nr:hypothetical protein [Candidatus Riflebacteria bacterium]